MLLADPSLPEEAFHKLRLAKREEADDAMSFAATIMKARYDGKHLAISFKEGDEVFLKLHHGYSIPGLANRKLSQQRVGPFKVLAKVGTLAYRLELPPVMRIHPVISVAQLEPAASISGPDRYGRKINLEPPPVINEDDAGKDEGKDGGRPYDVERVLDKRITRDKPWYLIKWKDYGNEHNVWYKLEDLANAMELVEEYESKVAAKASSTKKPQQSSDQPKHSQALVLRKPFATEHVQQKVETSQPSSEQKATTSQALIIKEPHASSETIPKRGRGRPRKNVT